MLEQLNSALAEFYTPIEAGVWMRSAHHQLQGRTPLDAIAAGDGAQVLQIVERLKDCVYL